MHINPIELLNYEPTKEYSVRSFKQLSYASINKNNDSQLIPFLSTSQMIKGQQAEILKINKKECQWRQVYQVSLNQQIKFNPGDSIGLICSNNDFYPNEILNILELVKNDSYSINVNGQVNFSYFGTIFDFFKHYYDFKAIPKRSFLSELIKDCKKKNELRYLISKDGRDDYFRLNINWNSIIDILIYFECRPTLDILVRYCEFIKPRHYSLINKEDDNCELLIGIYENKRNMCYGHVSEYILNAKIGDTLNFYHKENKNLRINMNCSKILMIATGTGIAPFISYIETDKLSFKWLIYGCRTENDNLAKSLDVKKDIVLSQNKMYVSDFIVKNEIEIDKFIHKNTHVYICGNQNMRRDVINIFKDKWPILFEENRIAMDDWS